jgi:hypothetical protein
MQQKLLTRLVLAAGLGLSAWSAMAEPGAGGDHPMAPGGAEPPAGHFGMPDGADGRHGGPEAGGPAEDRHGEDHGPGPMAGPAGEVLQTLHEIEHLYREQGRTREVIALYQEVLGKTRDPLVRHAAYEAIARAQAQPVDTDKAVVTLKQSLDESLQHLNQMPPPGPGLPPHEGKAAP